MNFEDEKPGDLLREREREEDYKTIPNFILFIKKNTNIFQEKATKKKTYTKSERKKVLFVRKREKMINNKIKCMNTMKPPNFSSFFFCDKNEPPNFEDPQSCLT